MRVTQKRIQAEIKKQYGIDGIRAVHYRNAPGWGVGVVNFRRLKEFQHDGKTLAVRDGQNLNIVDIQNLSDKTVEEWADIFGERMVVTDVTGQMEELAEI